RLRSRIMAANDSSSAAVDLSPNGLIGTSVTATLDNCNSVLQFVLAFRDATKGMALDPEVDEGVNETLAYVSDALNEQSRILEAANAQLAEVNSKASARRCKVAQRARHA